MARRYESNSYRENNVNKRIRISNATFAQFKVIQLNLSEFATVPTSDFMATLTHKHRDFPRVYISS